MSFLRFAIAILCISTFAFVSCSKDEEKPANQLDRASLINKTWVTTGTAIKYDGKTYSYGTEQTLTDISFLFKDNGEVIISADNDDDTSTWVLENKTIKIKDDEGTFDLVVNELKDKTLTIDLAKNLDPTKNPETLSIAEQNGFELAYALLLGREKIDITKSNKTVDVMLTLISK
ncbi:hypothetical protein [Siphonobacter curvatus]|uniref:Lipocalin-like domain-containing protein n=1 Tax=Siphonobacter curvatus TaxID=2094562 RepID=A0A2S7INZ5_9BACT|nr:hypothetical protein [Siphonobacter curvatus]PQA59338.1 hypothetical protein C5O19_06715 [Siphonobacter curvatus]